MLTRGRRYWFSFPFKKVLKSDSFKSSVQWQVGEQIIAGAGVDTEMTSEQAAGLVQGRNSSALDCLRQGKWREADRFERVYY